MLITTTNALRQSRRNKSTIRPVSTAPMAPSLTRSRIERPSTSIRTLERLQCNDHLQLIVALIDDLLPVKFPAYEAFRHRPFAFQGRREEIIGTITKNLRNPHELLQHFTIRPTFSLEALSSLFQIRLLSASSYP